MTYLIIAWLMLLYVLPIPTIIVSLIAWGSLCVFGDAVKSNREKVTQDLYSDHLGTNIAEGIKKEIEENK